MSPPAAPVRRAASDTIDVDGPAPVAMTARDVKYSTPSAAGAIYSLFQVPARYDYMLQSRKKNVPSGSG